MVDASGQFSPEKKVSIDTLSSQSIETRNAAPIEDAEFRVETNTETESQPEQTQEQQPEQTQDIASPINKRKKKKAIPVVRDALTAQVEQIMEEGLADAFKEMTPVQQQEFKIKGEETAQKIRQLMKASHVKIKKIFKLILEWLTLLPGVNRFFLEQEAKIKADKIVSLKNTQHS